MQGQLKATKGGKLEMEPWSAKQLCSLPCQHPWGWMAAVYHQGVWGRQGGQEPVTRSLQGGDMSMGCTGTERMRHLGLPLSTFSPVEDQIHKHCYFSNWEYFSRDLIIFQVSWFSGSAMGSDSCQNTEGSAVNDPCHSWGSDICSTETNCSAELTKRKRSLLKVHSPF